MRPLVGQLDKWPEPEPPLTAYHTNPILGLQRIPATRRCHLIRKVLARHETKAIDSDEKFGERPRSRLFPPSPSS